MLFQLTDRIVDYQPGRSIRARKLTSRAEPYWRESADDGPVMPPPLVLETLCQAGAWLVMLDTDVARRAALLSVSDTRFSGPVRPGDVLTVDATVESSSAERAVMSGVVRVDERTVLEASDVMCALVDTADLDDPAVTRRQLEALSGDLP
ncbi:3-hydroxyacyl-[acyl-carrier-protein] dehydratase [Haloactinopolyspora alba]|uniref:3-hydroxyacyl-[acyl-carrier-protein] dehydratase n=1 Tax=Haloactinopolyspora alba TaxID=648780 RepID=A0A2P8DYR3_9ACTN|nr:MaoC/PaaZ C-terminal domain-containing protein [Haloactinopolyspora alba]PSL02359.1 3-hydroxyacyl-[acyl-carrier-protein] dehydratase [Haloactinopolyspora alba]